MANLYDAGLDTGANMLRGGNGNPSFFLALSHFSFPA